MVAHEIPQTSGQQSGDGSRRDGCKLRRCERNPIARGGLASLVAEMKKRVALGIVGVALVAVGSAAEEVFTKAVEKADFSAAGLGKLSTEELARLDG